MCMFEWFNYFMFFCSFKLVFEGCILEVLGYRVFWDVGLSVICLFVMFLNFYYFVFNYMGYVILLFCMYCYSCLM